MMQAGATSRATGLAAGTIVYPDELPNAAVLVDSCRRFHPEIEFTVLVIAAPGEAVTLPHARVMALRDLGLEAGEEWRLPMLFGRDELRSLFKPALLDTMLGAKVGAAAWFSPSTEIFAPLSRILELVRLAHEIVATKPVENEWGDCGRSFFALPDQARPLLREWFDQMRARSASKNSGLTDDPRPFEALFDALPQRIFSEPGFALNYSNLDPATLHRTQEGHEVDGAPLQSFDYRGYDPAKPHLLSRYQGLVPKILLSQWPVLAELCDSYRDKLTRAGHRADSVTRRPFDFLPSGLPLDSRLLRTYRKALAQSRGGNGAEPPSPFGPTGEQGFLDWLNEPVDRANAGVTRFMLAVYEDRADVQRAYRDPTNADADAFVNWYRMYGQQELALPAVLVPAQRTALERVAPAPVPINIAGYFRAELGLGVAARSLLAALQTTDIPTNTLSFDATANRLSHPFTDDSSASGVADTNIICVNPDQIATFAGQTGREFWHGRYTIGVWFWEAEDFPRSFHGAFNYVDEIWVASEFMRETFLKVSPKPVFKFRLPVLVPPVDQSITRAQLNLPEEFIFLFSFDFLSVLERKNPLGLIQAFSKAFAPGEGPRLVIKTINGDKRTLEVEKLKYAIRGRPDILFIDRYLPSVENASLTALADCYVSLHRAEGFGLTIAEAMALGKPAIATGYSGNLEFMTPENSYLCPSSLCEVGPEREPYPADSHWSEPDVAAAAKLLRRVFEHREEAKARGVRAAADMRSARSPVVAGQIISERLEVIRRRRAQPRREYSIDFLRDRIEELEARLPKQP